MKIHVATNSGFCFGVKNAVNMTMDIAKTYKNVYTYGELIHNKQVIEKLNDLGVQTTLNIEELDESCSLIIRSHGVEPSVYQRAKCVGVNLVDATCPYVKKIHNIVESHHKEGFKIIIVGDYEHPEVIGINGYCDFEAIMIGNVKEIQQQKFDFLKGCVVAQTTIKRDLWEDVITHISNKITTNSELITYNTICSATTSRQVSTDDLSKKVDFMIVIGGHHSSNTQKLYQIAKKNCENTVYIETSEELMVKDMRKYDNIGITAGASTPDFIIDEIIKKLENEGEEYFNG